MNTIEDILLYARALTLRVARWETFKDVPGRGEVCVGAMRHVTEMGENGLPVMTGAIRVEPTSALEKR